MEKRIEIEAVYTGDSTNFYKFQVVDTSGGVVGSLYVPKSKDGLQVETIVTNLIIPARDKEAWSKGVNSLLDNSREGSKQESKLIKVLKNYN